MPRPSGQGRRPPHQTDKSVDAQPEAHAIDIHVNPLDQQLHDPGLLGREQLVPERVELQQRLPRLVLGDVVQLGAGRAPCPDDYLRLPEDAAQLVDDGRLDLRRRHAPDCACVYWGDFRWSGSGSVPNPLMPEAAGRARTVEGEKRGFSLHPT